MTSKWLDRYIDAWLPHPFAGSPEGGDALQTLLGFMSENVRYEDVPSNSVWSGHDGIATMCAGAFQMSADLTFEILTRQADGPFYAFETLGAGTNTGAIGPIPNMYDPYWAPTGKTLSVFAEGIAALAALSLFALLNSGARRKRLDA